MTSARQKILSHLKNNRSGTTREIARALDMGSPNTRHHLSILVADGRVEIKGVRPRSGRGRPEKMYSISEQALGDNLAGLAEALLAEAGMTVRLGAVAGRILDPDEFKGLPLTRRLSLLVEKLNELHYHSHWEAGAVGPRLILSRCPYAKIIENHPALCTMDAAVLESAVGSRMEQISKMDKTHGACIFVMR